MGRVKGSGGGRGEALSGGLLRGPSSYPKGYYFYSPQSSSVINQKWGPQQNGNNTNINQLSPVQDTHALQARQERIKPLYPLLG